MLHIPRCNAVQVELAMLFQKQPAKMAHETCRLDMSLTTQGMQEEAGLTVCKTRVEKPWVRHAEKLQILDLL